MAGGETEPVPGPRFLQPLKPSSKKTLKISRKFEASLGQDVAELAALEARQNKHIQEATNRRTAKTEHGTALQNTELEGLA